MEARTRAVCRTSAVSPDIDTELAFGFGASQVDRLVHHILQSIRSHRIARRGKAAAFKVGTLDHLRAKELSSRAAFWSQRSSASAASPWGASYRRRAARGERAAWLPAPNASSEACQPGRRRQDAPRSITDHDLDPSDYGSIAPRSMSCAPNSSRQVPLTSMIATAAYDLPTTFPSLSVIRAAEQVGLQTQKWNDRPKAGALSVKRMTSRPILRSGREIFDQ